MAAEMSWPNLFHPNEEKGTAASRNAAIRSFFIVLFIYSGLTMISS